MKLFESFILGALQGIAEFLPISSSGHLLIAQEIMNVNYQGNVLEVATHLGTLLSIIVVFRNEIISLITGLKNKKNQYYVICLIIGTIPAAADQKTSWTSLGEMPIHFFEEGQHHY